MARVNLKLPSAFSFAPLPPFHGSEICWQSWFQGGRGWASLGLYLLTLCTFCRCFVLYKSQETSVASALL